MDISLLIGIATVLFIAGILLVIKGASSEEQTAVPISDPKEIEELKSAFVPIRQTAGSSTASTLHESPSGHPVANVPETDPVKDENELLIKQIAEQNAKYRQLEQNFEIFKLEYQQLKDTESKEVRLLEEQLKKLQAEKEVLTGSQAMVGELKTRVEQSEKQLAEGRERQSQLQLQIQKLETERDALRNEQRLAIDKSELEALSGRLESSIAALETLKGENKSLLESNQNLKNYFKETEEFNTHLLEKERIMQFELAKNRAQALGLEKMCEDFKVQIEAMSALASRES